MRPIVLPEYLQSLIEEGLSQINRSPDYDLPPHLRLEIYRAFGPISIKTYDEMLEQVRKKQLRVLAEADLIRTQLAILTANKVIPLWEQACRETNLGFSKADFEAEAHQKEVIEIYRNNRKKKSIEEISVYDVPRRFVPKHIMEMTMLALEGKVINQEAFFKEANEWWQIYGHPALAPREFSIKWAVQEALYEAIGYSKFGFRNLHHENYQDQVAFPYLHDKAPAGFALIAYAGVFDQGSYTFDLSRRREFWHWWLSEAIPTALNMVTGGLEGG
jgi:hypothetical protein